MATTTRRYLVIANQTLAEAELTDAIRQRLEAGPSSFYLLVPSTDHGDLAARISRGAPIAPAAGDATADHQSTEHAQHRLGQLMDDLRRLNADVDGNIGNPDPLKAATELLERQQFDEIILSTLPHTGSRWLRQNLPAKLKKLGLPVTHIVAG